MNKIKEFKIGQRVKVLTLDEHSNKSRMIGTIGKIGIVKPNLGEDRKGLIRVSFSNVKDNREGMGWVYSPSSLRSAKLKLG